MCYRAEEIVGRIDVHNLRPVVGTDNHTPRLKGPVVQDSSSTVAELKELVGNFVAERQWEPFHDAKNLSASIAIEAAELMEHFQWLRSEQLEAVKEDSGKMAEIREEVADIAAYLFSFASAMEIDLSAALADKMKKNATKYPKEEYRGRFG